MQPLFAIMDYNAAYTALEAVGIVLTLLGIAWRLSGRFQRVEDKVDGVDAKVDGLGRTQRQMWRKLRTHDRAIEDLRGRIGWTRATIEGPWTSGYVQADRVPEKPGL